MLYAVICYHSEAGVAELTPQQDEALMNNLAVVHQELAAEGKWGPAARLMPTTAAVTLRPRNTPSITDGPFAETKEALLGFYILDCASLDEAIEATHRLAAPRTAAGLHSALEIRPVRLFVPGSSVK